MSDLKQCPFCGSYAYAEENEYIIGNNDFVIRCASVSCPVRPHVRRATKTEAIECWNTRYNPF